MTEKHMLSVLVEDKPGVMQRVSGLFRQRAFNIDSIAVGPCEKEGFSRITLVTSGDEKVLEQVRKQLEKLVEVIKVSEMNPDECVVRELALAKIHAPTGAIRSEIIQYANIFRASVVDVGPETLTIEITGDPDKIKAFLDMMKPFGIRELVRTGITSITRGARLIEEV
ncbi:MAG: acetolactate synthase small subunit [Candidatus Hydrothermarchaeota archaeon]